jgi:hypothetical protein
MKRMLVWIVAIGSSFLLLRLFVYVFPEAVCILVAWLLLFTLLLFFGISMKAGVTSWRHTSGLWALPALMCAAYIVIGLVVIPPIGPYITDWLFMKNLNTYSSVVDDFRNGTISCTRPCTGKMELMHLARRPAYVLDVWGVHCDDGGAIVLFLSDSDVPLLHEGFFFKDYGASSNCEKESLSPESGWPNAAFVRHIVGRWYHFSDQPGL